MTVDPNIEENKKLADVANTVENKKEEAQKTYDEAANTTSSADDFDFDARSAEIDKFVSDFETAAAKSEKARVQKTEPQQVVEKQPVAEKQAASGSARKAQVAPQEDFVSEVRRLNAGGADVVDGRYIEYDPDTKNVKSVTNPNTNTYTLYDPVTGKATETGDIIGKRAEPEAPKKEKDMLHNVYIKPYGNSIYGTKTASIIDYNNPLVKTATEISRYPGAKAVNTERYDNMSFDELAKEAKMLEHQWAKGGGSVDFYNAAATHAYVARLMQAKELGFKSIADMDSNRGVRAVRLYKDQLIKYAGGKYSYYLDYSPSALESLNPIKDITLSPDNEDSAIPKKVRNLMLVDKEHGIKRPYAYYINLALSDPDFRDRYDFWSLAYAGAKNVDWDKAREMGVVAFNRQQGEQKRKFIEEEGKRLNENSFAYVFNKAWNSSFTGGLVNSMFMSPEDRRRNLEILSAAEMIALNEGKGKDFGFRAANAGRELAAGLGALAFDYGWFKPVGVGATATTTKLFGREALEYGFGRTINTAINLGLFGVLGQAGSDLNRGEFSGFIPYGEALGRGALGGVVLGRASNATAKGLFSNATRMGRGANEVYRFLAKGSAFAAPDLVEQANSGQFMSLESIAFTLGHSVGVVVGLEGAHTLKGRPRAKDSSIKAIEDLGYNDLANVVKENRERIANGERPLEMTPTEQHQWELVMQGLREGNSPVSWDTLADLGLMVNRAVVPPSPSSSRVVARGGKYVVQVCDRFDNVIKEEEKKSRAEADKLTEKFAREIAHEEEKINYESYENARSMNAMQSAAADIADALNAERGAGSPFLEGGEPNPDYIGETPESVMLEYQKALNTPTDRLTEEQVKLMKDYEAAYEGKLAESDASSAESIAKSICEQYGVDYEKFDAALNEAPEKRKKDNVAKAIAAFNNVMAKGYDLQNGKAKGEATIDGKKVEVLNEVQTDEMGIPLSDRDYLYYRDENGVVQMTTTEDVGAIEYYEKAGDLREDGYQVSRDNSSRLYAQANEEYTKYVKNLSDEELMGLRKQMEEDGDERSLRIVENEMRERGMNLEYEPEESEIATPRSTDEPPIELDENGTVVGGDATQEPPIELDGEGKVVDAERSTIPVTESNLVEVVGIPEEYREDWQRYWEQNPPKDAIDVLLDGMDVMDEEMRGQMRKSYEENPDFFQKEWDKWMNGISVADVERALGLEPTVREEVRADEVQEQKEPTPTNEPVAEKPAVEPVEAPKPENKMQPVKVEEEKPKVEKPAPEPVREEAKGKTPKAVEPTAENIEKLLDAMGVEGDDRASFRSEYESNPEAFKSDYDEFVGGKPTEKTAQEETTTETPAPVAKETTPTAETAEESNEIVSDNNKPFPVKEVKGKKIPDYNRATPERIRHFLYEEMGLDKETADGIVKQGIEEAKEAIKKHKKKEPKAPKPDEVFEHAEKKKEWQKEMKALEDTLANWEGVVDAQSDYELLDQVQNAKSPKSMSDLVSKLRVRYGSNRRDPEIYQALTYFEPKSLYDACMDFLASGARFIWNSEGAKKGLKQHTGWGDGERRKMIGMIAKEENGGITPEAAVHRIVDLYGQDLGIDLSQSDVILNTLLDALRSVSTKGEANAYVNERKLAAVEDILRKRLEGEASSRYDAEADRRADEEFEALKEEYKDELPENPTEEDVVNLMEQKRQGAEEPQPIEEEKQNEREEEPAPDDKGISDDFFAQGEEEQPPFSLKQEGENGMETVAKDVREHLEKNVGKELTDRIEEVAKRMGVEVRLTDMNVNGVMSSGVLYIGKKLDPDKTATFVAGHEFTHEMQHRAEGKGSDVYDIFKDAALEWAKNHPEEGGRGYDFDYLKGLYERFFKDKFKKDALGRGMSEEEADAYAERLTKDRVTDDYINNEITANVAGRMLENPAIAEDMFKLREAETPQERRNALRRILDWIKEYISKRIGNKKEEELTPEEQRLLELRDKFNDMYNEVVREDLDAQGIETADNGDAAYSIRSLPDKDQREKLIEGLMQQTGRSRRTVEKWLKSETSLASMIMRDLETLDYTPDPRDPAIKSNSDYPQGTVDFSNICRKRKDFTSIYSILQKENPNRVFTALDLEEIRQTMIEDGYTVACGLCFVEDRRQLLGEIAEDFINRLQNNDLKPASQKKLGDDTYVPTIAELITPEGSKRLAEEHPTVWEAFRAHNNARGQQAGRLYEGYNEYKREILNWNDSKVKKVNDAGGLRIFSFSDFEAPQLLDIIQVIEDCASRGVKIQGYTKVPEFAKAMSKTGVKINQSLIPKGDGYKVVDGKEVLDYDPVEGIDINDKNFVSDPNNPNIGTILVGINDKQIRLAMVDPFVDYIIPFHTKIAKEVLTKKGIGNWTNYKNFQRDHDLSTGRAAEKEVNIYTDVLQAAEAEGNPITNKREFVEKFLKVCEERGLEPRFSQFLDKDADGKYIYTEGYHKFLIDFKLFDKKGKILPQEVVKPIFDDAFNKEILDNYSKDAKVEKDYGETLGKLRERLGLESPRRTRFEDMAEQYSLKEDTAKREELRDSEESKKLFDATKEKFGTTNDFKEAGYILPDGTMLDFSGRHWVNKDADTSHLAGNRAVDHRAIHEVGWDENEDPTGFKTSMTDFIERGAIRINGPYGINLSVPPTREQEATLRRYMQGKKVVSIDFGNGDNTEHAVWYGDDIHPNAPYPNVSRILADIDRYFYEGIKPKGDPYPYFSLKEDERRPTFYSNAARAVENIKQNKATAEQWLAMIKKNGGLKAGEDKWMGLSQWLEDNKGKSLTKEEVQQFIADNSIEMEEVNYKDDMSVAFEEAMKPVEREFEELMEVAAKESGLRNVYDQAEWAFEKMSERHGEEFDKAFDLEYNNLGGVEIVPVRGMNDSLTESAKDYLGLNAESSEQEIHPTRLEYTTKGLDNKREIAFKVPSIEPYKEYDEVHFGPENQGKAVMWVRFGETNTAPRNGYAATDILNELEKKYGGTDAYDKMSDKDAAKRFFANYVERGENADMDVSRMEMEQELGVKRTDKVFPLFEEMVDNIANGKRVLVIDEIQSNRHQEGRKHGYISEYKNSSHDKYQDAVAAMEDFQTAMEEKYGEFYLSDQLTAEERKEYDRLYKALNETGDASIEDKKTYDVPDAPFEHNWHEVAMKRMLRLAAEEGFDKVAWTTGEQQAERYNLGGKIDSIYIGQSRNSSDRYSVMAYDKNADVIHAGTGDFTPKQMEEIFGKSITRQLIEGHKTQAEKIGNEYLQYHIDGVDLDIGGKGMRGFYDQMLPRFMDKYGKRWGVKTGTVELPNVTGAGRTMHSVDITPEMKESVMEGQPLFSLRQGRSVDDLNREIRDLLRRRARGEDVSAELDRLRAERDAAMASAEQGQQPVAEPQRVEQTQQEELPPTDYDRPRTPIEMAKTVALKVINDTKASFEEKNRARKELTASLKNLHKAMHLQKEYDKATIENVVSLAKMMYDSRLIDAEHRREMSSLFTSIKRGAPKTPQGLETAVNGMMDIMLKSQERTLRSEISRLLNTKGVKVDSNGVLKQAGLDIRGQHTMSELSEYMGKGSVIIDNRIEKLEDMSRRVRTDDTERKQAIDDKITGCLLAKQFSEIDENYGVNIKSVGEELEDIKEMHKQGLLSNKEYTEQKRALEAQKRSYRMSQADALWSAISAMNHIIEGSKNDAKNWIDQQQKHREEIRHNAYSDMEGVSSSTQSRPGVLAKAANGSLSKFFSSSLFTLDTMLRQLGRKHANGEGYLYNRYARGWVDARDREITDYWNDREVLDAKAKELFGVKHYSDLINVLRKKPKMEVEWLDGGERTPHTMDQAQLMYIYMVNKMEDGIVKLRRMGILEEDVERIKNHLDPKVVELADWLQKDFLPSKREGYNEVHRRMFGADMDMVENYVPLRIDKGGLKEDVDVNNQQSNPSLASTVTGGVIKRTHNTMGLDLMGTNGIDLILEHLDEMNHWKNFAEWNRDVNTLLSDKTFRNKVKNMTTIYGSGDQLWSRLKDVFFIAAGTYRPEGKDVDKALVNIAKGVSAAKVSFRAFTAAKQLLSLPVFAANCNMGYMALNLLRPAGSWNWCMENLPSFKNRWRSRIAGDTRLEDTDIDWRYTHKKWVEKASKWGLTPNAFIDAMTVAVGARSVYEQRYKRYKKDGYTDEQADRRAKQDATLAFNQSQQSSEKLFVAPMQVDRTLLSVGASVFRNASMGYERQFIEGTRNLKHLFKKGYKAESIEFMTKQMVRDGLTETQARTAANRIYRRSKFRNALKVAMFGFVAQMAWNLGGKLPYMTAQAYNAITGEGDDKKKAGQNALGTLKDEAWHALLGGWLEGLPFGNVVSEGINNEWNGEKFFKYNPDIIPLFGDITDAVNRYDSNNKLRGVNDLVNLGAQIFIGVNPQTFTDVITGIVDSCFEADKKDEMSFGTAKEALMIAMRVLQCPQSQLDQLFIDELGMSAREARNLTPEALARRYAYMKAHKDAPALWWLYNEEQKDGIIKQYEKNFNKKISGDAKKDDEKTVEEFYELAETAKTQEKRTDYYKEARRSVKEAGDAQKAYEMYQKELAAYRRDSTEQHINNANAWYDLYQELQGTPTEKTEAKDLNVHATLADVDGDKRAAMVFNEDEMNSYRNLVNVEKKYANDPVVKEALRLGGKRSGKNGGWEAKAKKYRPQFDRYYNQHKEKLDSAFFAYWDKKNILEMLKEYKKDGSEENNKRAAEIKKAFDYWNKK